ncbi:MAG: CPBP family intramembrane metalloprotease [Bacteroidales bacterium]|jgi:membrane protease YdiL (CAAX protease family)|nr:CPBP family intramembrane metalloprotease [Bacteroidales bacterium]
MFKRYSYFLPDLLQSWVIVLLLLTVAGGLTALIVNLLLLHLFPALSGGIEIVTYPLIFIPAAIYIHLCVTKDERRVKADEATIRESAPFNKPDFGKLGVIKTFMLLVPLVFAFNLITEPLSKWMGVPDFLETLLVQINENKIISFISVVIFAPLLEEILCRGVILRSLLKHTTPLKAIVWSSVMFGVMHMNPWQAIPAFMIGLLIGWIYWRSGSLWSAIFIHFINNGFSYTITVLFPQLPANYGFIDIIPEGFYFPVYLFSLIFILATIYIMDKNYGKVIPA